MNKVNTTFNHDKILNAISVLKQKGVSSEEIIFVGGTVFEHLGLREASDIDVIISPEKYSILASESSVNLKGPFDAIDIDNDIQILKNPYRHLDLSDEECFRLKLYKELTLKNQGVIKIALPELEFGKKIFRNREKDRYDILLLQKSAINNPAWRWDIIPIKMSKDNALVNFKLNKSKRLIKRAIKNPFKSFGFIFDRLRHKWFRKTKSLEPKDLAISLIDVGTLLQWQYDSKTFHRYDVLMRKITLERFLSAQENGNVSNDWLKEVFKEYVKMQYHRVGGSNLSYLRFENLIKSVALKGFLLDRNPISVDNKGRLIDGSHRLAIALAENLKQIPVRFENKKTGPIDYGRNWFKKKGFDDNLLKQLDQELYQSLLKTGAFFILIIWPPAQQFTEEIRNYMSSRYEIVAQSINNEISRSSEFIKEIYISDDIEDWKIQKKIYHMKDFTPVFSVIAFRVDKPNYRVKSRTGSYLSDHIAKLKSDIRMKHRTEVQNYVHDIILHIADNPSMNRDTLNVLEKYGIKL